MEENIYFKREVFVIRESDSDKIDKNEVTTLLNDIIYNSIELKASDIHIESKEKEIVVRLRIDGILQNYKIFDKNIGIKLISKIKILSELDVGEKRLPQDGRFKGTYNTEKIDFRVSFIPTIFGERCVIRLLKNDIDKTSIYSLGFSNENLMKLQELLKKKNGLLLFCGPTGSGKTTTLYSIANYLSNATLNIITIEDPIEYQFSEINQIQCKNEIGLNFATILRSILRQDPDVIIIGEIRDKETAEIALMASLTGHLVISTLHTKDSISAIDRLLNFGIDKFVIASAINAIESQRLVRKICPICKGKNINNNLECCFDGFKGREIVEEIIFFDNEIRNIILNENATNIKKYLDKNNFKTLLHAGMEKVKQGVTTEIEIKKECLI